MKLLNKLNPKTVNLDAIGGPITITQTDILTVISTCDASPLTQSHLFAKYQIGDTDLVLLDFYQKLKPFMYHHLLCREPSIDVKTLNKYHVSIIHALDDVTTCVHGYLTRDKIKNDNLRSYMPQPSKIKVDTFRRRYSKFLLSVVHKLEYELSLLERQIIQKTKK